MHLLILTVTIRIQRHKIMETTNMAPGVPVRWLRLPSTTIVVWAWRTMPVLAVSKSNILYMPILPIH